MKKIPDGLVNFNIQDPPPQCGQWKKHMPRVRDAKIFEKYISARQLWRSKLEWQLTKEEALHILSDVKAAAVAGDWGARALMAYFYREGLGPLPKNNVLEPDMDKSVAIARMAVAAGQPWGFYDLGVAHEHGYGGANQNNSIAWAYYLRAAELGSPEAQMALAEAYGQANKLIDEEAMLECAFLQGHGLAAYKLGLRAMVRRQYVKGIEIYQKGIEYGCGDCATEMWILFEKGAWLDATSKEIEDFAVAGIIVDLERAKRYEIIADALEINPDLRFSNLEKNLPLPPKSLPEWLGVENILEPYNFKNPSY